MVPKNMSTLAVLRLLNKGDSLVCIGKKNNRRKSFVTGLTLFISTRVNFHDSKMRYDIEGTEQAMWRNRLSVGHKKATVAKSCAVLSSIQGHCVILSTFVQDVLTFEIRVLFSSP